MWRGMFSFRIQGAPAERFEMAGSEWLLFQRLRRMSARGESFAWFESYGAPLVPRSLAALNCYLRSGAIRKFSSGRFDDGRELIGRREWRRLCSLLALRFDGRGTRQAA